VDQLRLDLAATGPQSGRPGFEIFDSRGFGDTEFQEQVKFRRALEGELGRTIGTLNTVSTARVHISLGKETLFGDGSRPAKASVVLKLRGTRDLPASSVEGIRNLVASSVESLQADAVTIMDSYGRPLARPTADDELVPGSMAQTERQRNREREIGMQVVSLLEPVLGPDRVRVNVALKMISATVQETEERFNPSPIVRSETDHRRFDDDGAGRRRARGRAQQPASAGARSQRCQECGHAGLAPGSNSSPGPDASAGATAERHRRESQRQDSQLRNGPPSGRDAAASRRRRAHVVGRRRR
jgi:flagellar M-ring protein FliF